MTAPSVLAISSLVCVSLLLSACTDNDPTNLSSQFLTDAASPFLEKAFHSDEGFILALAKWQRTQPPARYYQHQRSSRARDLIGVYLAQGLSIRSNPPISPSPPVDWAANPLGDRNWIFQKNAMYVLAPFVQMHERTNDPEYLNTAKRLLLDWIDYNQTRNIDNPFKWYDMGTGLRAIVLAYVVDSELRSANPDVAALKIMIRSLLVHLQELSDPDKLAEGNHAYFQLLGVAAVCKALPLLHLCSKTNEYANENMNELIVGQFTGEGIQREHAPSYHAFSLSRARKILATNWFELSEEALKRLNLAERNQGWLHHPNGTMAMIGDSARGRIRTGLFDSIIAEGDSSSGFGKAFPLSGYAILRSDWHQLPTEQHSYLFFWAGEEQPGETVPHSYGHSHADNFTFEWSEGLVPVLTDSGKYSYEQDEWRDFFVSTRAHNTIEIDGKNTDNVMSTNRWDFQREFPRILSTSSFSGLQHIEALMTRQPADAEHRRLLVLNPGNWLVVIDSIAANEAKDVVQWFHFHEDWTLERNDPYVNGKHENASVGVYSLLGNEDVYITRGSTDPQIQGWVSSEYLQREPRYSLGYRAAGERVNFASLFLWESDKNTKLDTPLISIKDELIEACWSINGQADGFSYSSGEVKPLSGCNVR